MEQFRFWRTLERTTPAAFIGSVSPNFESDGTVSPIASFLLPRNVEAEVTAPVLLIFLPQIFLPNNLRALRSVRASHPKLEGLEMRSKTQPSVRSVSSCKMNQRICV